MHEQLSPFAAKRPSKPAPACPTTALRAHSHPPTSIAVNLKWLAKVLWLFTKTDIHNLVLPACTMNLVIHSLFAPVSHVSHLTIIVSAVKTFVWGYLGLLVIDVTNQLTGMDEDKLNKPFRPLPAGLISVPGAMRLTVIAACMFVVVADRMGVLWCALSFVAATSTYNFTGADKHWLGKNVCNAWGYGCYFAAGGWIAWWDIAKSVGIENAAVLDDVALTVKCLTLLHSVTILATITIQDLRDVDGDLQSHRSTQNLALGEWPARTQIVVCMSVATVLGATRSWKVAGYHVLKVLGLSGPTRAPVWEGMATWSTGSATYYSALSALVAWVGGRIMHDCPTYAIVALDAVDEHVKLTSKWLDLARQAKRLGINAPRTATSSDDNHTGESAANARGKKTGAQYDSGVLCAHAVDTTQWESELKRAQYERDDVSFKLYILWLYLYIYTAVF